MFGVSLIIFCLLFVQFSSCFTSGLIGLVFGVRRFCFCRCGVSQKTIMDTFRTGRFLGGEQVTPHQYPWLAFVTTYSLSFGGSLISDRHVLTAASPLYGISSNSISVTLGAYDRCHVGNDLALNNSVTQVILHPGYSPTNMENDIALLKLKHMVQFSPYVSPICLPRFGSDDANQVAWIAGWNSDGNTSTCTPRVVTLPMLPEETCFKTALDSKFVTHDKGCLGPVGIKNIVCMVDAGTPVMTRRPSGVYRMSGVMSPVSSCSQQSAPLYTKVIDHSTWIHNQIRSDCQCV